MATSDLANELAKPSFHFDNGATEKQVTDVVLTQLDDQSSDISSLATKCLGLLANKVGEERLRAITVSLLQTMITARKEQQRDVASLALKTVVTELQPGKAHVLAQAAAPHLLEGLRSTSPDVASNSLDTLVEIASRHGACLPNIETLRDALIPELDASRAGIRKRAIHCLALLASYLPTASLDSLCDAIFLRLESSSSSTTSSSKEQARSYIQALGALSKSVGFKLGPHMSRAVPLVLVRLKSAEEGDDELMELSLVAVESFIQRCPADTRPFLDELTDVCLQFLKFDPNYAADDENEDEVMGGGSDDEDDFEEDEEVYSDDEDGSWKVRRAGAKLAAALVSQYPDVLLNIYRQLAPALVSKFKEREEAVRPDIYQSYNDLTRAVGAAARRGDAAAQAALDADVPSVLRALAKQLRGKSTKTKSLALKSLQELVRAAPAAVVSGLGDVVSGVKSALEDKTSGASALKIDALAFLNAALAASPPAAFQGYAAALAPAVFAAAADRYYAVSAEALRACEQFVHVLRPQCPGPIDGQLAPLVAPLFDVAAGRLGAQDLSLEVKDASISCAAAAVAVLGDALEGDTEKVGTLAEEFAAMPRSRGRASKRAKTEKGAKTTASSPSDNPAADGAASGGGGGVHPSSKISEVLGILLDRLKNDMTRLTAVRAFGTIAKTPLPLDLSPIVPQALAELTTFLRKANRQLRLASLSALTALVARGGSRTDPAALESTVAETANLVNDADLAVAAAALRLVETVVKQQTRAVGAVCEKIMHPAVALVGSPLLQGGVLEALQSLLSALEQSGSAEASFDRLFEMLSAAGTATAAAPGAPMAAARCAAVLCRSAGQDKVQSTAKTLLAALETSETDDATRRFALLCLGELGRGCDLTSFSGLPTALTSALASEAIAEAASFALGGVASGNLAAYLPLLLQQVKAQAKDAKMQYQLLRALNEVITTTAHKPSSSSSSISLGGDDEDIGGATETLMAADQVHEVLSLLLSNASEREEECSAVVSECLGHLALIAPADVLGALQEHLSAAAPESRTVAVSALKNAAVERLHPVDEPLTELLPQALQCISDSDVNVRKAGVHLLTAAVHNKPALLENSLDSVLPLVFTQTKPDPSLIRTVDLGPFKHKIDDGLELRKAAFESLGVLMGRCYDRLDPNILLAALVDGLSDAYDVKMQCHALLSTLAVLAPGAVSSSLDRLVEPLTATLTAKVKSDAVKQEVDRNEDMLRSCLRAISAVNTLPSAANVQAFKQFMEEKVTAGAMKERYAAILAEKRQAEGRGGVIRGVGGGAGGLDAMDMS